MNCMNCGARLGKADLEFCPHCGANVLIQRKVDYLSRYYYNQGLEKASIRDLSGAISCLKQSLTYDKNNIRARNLLGLVYFETGEVVAALSEWVISKNLQPNRNLASDYITRLQSNSGKLEAINETIRKYNHALELCRQGHEDMAAVQLRRILTQNSKLIKGYHLLALIYMKNHEWNRARRTLRKAARIDKTNTTTLRFLKEVDERTGVTTRLEKSQRKGFFGLGGREESDLLDIEVPVKTRSYDKVRTRVPLFFMLVLGMAAGFGAFYLLVMPGIRQGIYRQANQQIVKYSESLASQGVELTRAQGEALESGNTAEAIAAQIEVEKKKSNSLAYLLSAYYYVNQDDLVDAALDIQKVYQSTITDDTRPIYNLVVNQTGVEGIDDTGTDEAEAVETVEDTSGETGDSGYYASYDEEEETYDESSEETYDESSEETYDESSDESYDESYEEYYDESYEEY